MSLGHRFHAVGLRAAVVLFVSSPLASAQPALVVHWSGGRLSVVAQNASLARVLREITDQTGVEIVGLERIQQSRSIEFADKLLADGLKLLLEDIDYVMVVRDPMALTRRPPAIRILLHSGSSPTDVPVQRRDRDVPTNVPAFGEPGRDVPTDGPALQEPGPDAPADVPAFEEPVPSLADGSRSEGDVPGPDMTDQEITAIAEGSGVDPELQSLESSRFFDEASESSVLQAASSGNAAVRARAIKALSERDSPLSAGALGIAMTDSDREVSSVASTLMADSNAPTVFENLGSVLGHPDPALRFNALELLARRADPESLPYLWPLLSDENDTIRTTAQRLVEQLLQAMNRER